MFETPSLLRGRYAFLSLVEAEGKASRWLAREADAARRVVAMVVTRERGAQLQKQCGVQHAHLATLLEVVSSADKSAIPAGVELPAGGMVGVAELVPGRTLAQHIEQQAMAPGKAVAWILRLIEAVQALHARGAVHGAISPWAVVAEPEGRAIAPVLSALLAPPVGAYCPPERLKGAQPAASDDVWALHATLYAALTGKPPFVATQREALTKQMLVGRPKPLTEHGVEQPVLQEILSRGLMGEKRLRVTDLAELHKALDAWERDPRAMPARRHAPPRATSRNLGEIAALAAAVPDPDIIIDSAGLPADLGLEAVPGGRGQPPPLPVTPSLLGGGPPPLPANGGPPPLPLTGGGPPPLPAATNNGGPPPLPMGGAPRPAPAVSGGPPPLPSSITPALPTPVHPAAIPPPPPAAPAHAAATPVPGSAPLLDAVGSSPNGTLSALIQELPREIPGPKPPIGAPARPVARRLSFNPFERKRKLWPIVAGAASAGGLGVYLLLSASGSPAAPAAVPSASVAQVPSKPRAPEKRVISPEEKRDTCVRSYFPERTISKEQSFEFLCEDKDFRDITKRLFTVVKQQPLNVPPGATASERQKLEGAAQLGWYELPAAGIVRQGCCVAAAPLNLPETVGWCEQLESAVRRIADDSQKAGDLAPGARAFDKAVTCLYVHGISRPYTYERSSSAQRSAFQQFLSSAAISEARR